MGGDEHNLLLSSILFVFLVTNCNLYLFIFPPPHGYILPMLNSVTNRKMKIIWQPKEQQKHAGFDIQNYTVNIKIARER